MFVSKPVVRKHFAVHHRLHRGLFLPEAAYVSGARAPGSFGSPQAEYGESGIGAQKDLVAEAMSVPCIAAVVMSAALSIPGCWERF